MPLVDIKTQEGNIGIPDAFVRELMRAIPQMFAGHASELGLSPNTPPEGVQVTRDWFDVDDVNVPDIWVKVQFSEPYPGAEPFRHITETVRTLLLRWFHLRGCEPDNIAIDLIPGPTHGWLMIDGVEIEW